jgi:hypothetical protein
VYDGIPYGRYLDTSSCRVSVDSIRLKFTYKYQNYSYEKKCSVTTIDQLSCHIDNMFFNGCDTKWSYKDFFQIGSYCRTCTISGINWSCAVLFGRYCYDSSCKQIAPEAVFDFNPNKVPLEILQQVIARLRGPALIVELVRFDIAFDFPCKREAVTLVQDQRRSYRLFRGKGAITEYQGARSSHGSLKLYDKTKESGLSCDVTRCEITVEGEYTGAFSELFPRIYCFDLLQLDINFASLPFHVKACLVHPDLVQLMLTSVDKKTRRKYLSMLDKVSNSSLAPDDWQAVDRFIPSALAEYAGPYTKRRHVII